ncbi:MAG: hypothetical protein ACYDAC_11715 [Candidatus Dormibacteria bacterium]
MPSLETCAAAPAASDLDGEPDRQRPRLRHLLLELLRRRPQLDSTATASDVRHVHQNALVDVVGRCLIRR